MHKTIDQMKRVLLLYVCLLQCLTIQAVNIVFRYDDYRLIPDSLQERLLETFNKHNIPISIAVVPCHNDSLLFKEGAYLSLLKTMNCEGLVEIALHGLNHSNISGEGEFIGITIQKQLDMLSKGKRILDSLFDSTQTFIPPYNAYDDNTLKALEILGFDCISSEMYDGHSLSSKRLQYYPETIDHPNKLIKAIEDNKNRNGIIILMFHNYDFDESFSMEKLDSLLMSIRNMKDIECLTFKMLCDRHIRSDGSRIKANVEVNLLSKMLKTGQMLQTKPFAITIRICNLMIYAIIALIIILFGRFAFGIHTKEYYIGAGIILALSCIIVWWHFLTPLKSMMVILLTSIIYVIVCSLKKQSKR
jgi:peptidoglycan/xylan/chitin deacetylase (PgdA/CDA1 family)